MTIMSATNFFCSILYSIGPDIFQIITTPKCTLFGEHEFRWWNNCCWNDEVKDTTAHTPTPFAGLTFSYLTNEKE
jgi:hypothetical protein